jgi:nitrogen-specific signal transduction histidine kinase
VISLPKVAEQTRSKRTKCPQGNKQEKFLSHDLRSPLAGIIQGAQYLEANFNNLL